MHYSISDLEQLSGVHAHTIRMWEQRYNALEPHRSAGNTRFYDDEQLKRLLNIVSINKKGLKISKICALSNQEIKDLIDEQISNTKNSEQELEFYISQLINAGISYNEQEFSFLLDECITSYGLSKTYVEIIYPLLVRLGLMWQKDSICTAQEHFLTHIIRQKMVLAIDETEFTNQSAEKWLLFLPEGETHEIGILFANYLLRKAGKRVIYLGANVPSSAVNDVVKSTKIDCLLLFMVQTKLDEHLQTYLMQISNQFSHLPIYIAGSSVLFKGIELPKNIIHIATINQLESMINPRTNVH